MSKASEIDKASLREPTGNRWRLVELLCTCQPGKGALLSFITQSHIEKRHVTWLCRKGLAKTFSARSRFVGDITVLLATDTLREVFSKD